MADIQIPDVDVSHSTMSTTTATGIKVGDVLRKEWGPGPVGFLRVIAVSDTTIGVDQEPGNRHQRRRAWAIRRKGR